MNSYDEEKQEGMPLWQLALILVAACAAFAIMAFGLNQLTVFLNSIN